MKIYHAHPRTGEYVGVTDARPDPREPGQFLIPAHAYTDAPGAAPAGKVMVREAGRWVAKTPPSGAPASPDAALSDRVRTEVQARIHARASVNTQINMVAARAAGMLDASQEAAFADAVSWVGAMRAKGQQLIAAGDETYSEDHHWPEPSEAAVNLAAQF